MKIYDLLEKSENQKAECRRVSMFRWPSLIFRGGWTSWGGGAGLHGRESLAFCAKRGVSGPQILRFWKEIIQLTYY